MKRCEICGKPSDQDVADTWAESGEDDYINFSVVAKTYRCSDHARDGVTYTKEQKVFDSLVDHDDTVMLVE